MIFDFLYDFLPVASRNVESSQELQVVEKSAVHIVDVDAASKECVPDHKGEIQLDFFEVAIFVVEISSHGQQSATSTITLDSSDLVTLDQGISTDSLSQGRSPPRRCKAIMRPIESSSRNTGTRNFLAVKNTFTPRKDLLPVKA